MEKQRWIKKEQGIVVGLRMSQELHHKVKLYCIKNDILMQDFIAQALLNALTIKKEKTL